MKPYRLIYQMDSSGVLPAATDVNDYLKGIVGFLEGSHIGGNPRSLLISHN